MDRTRLAAAARTLIDRLDEVPDRRLFALSVLWVVAAGLALQLVILPYVVPFAHAGHGLIANLDSPGFHATAVELSQRIRIDGFEAWRFVHDGTNDYVVAVLSLLYLIYPEPWIALPFNGVIFGATLVAIRRILAVVAESRGVGLAALAPFLLFPSFVPIWGQPHKDLNTGMGLSLVLYALVLAAYRTRQTARLPLLAGFALAGMGIVWLTRPYALTLVTAATVVFAIVAGLGRKCRRARLATVTAAVLLVGTSYLTGWAAVRTAIEEKAFPLAPPSPQSPSSLPESSSSLPQSPSSPSESPSTVSPATTRGSSDDDPAAADRPLLDWRSIRLPRTRRVDAATPRYDNCLPRPSDGMSDRLMYSLCYVREGFILDAQRAGSSSGYDYDIRLRTPEDFVAYAPRALALVLLEPGPSRWGTERTTLGSLATLFVPFEMTVAYAAFLLALLFGRRWLARSSVWAVTLFCTSYTLIYALATPQIGNLYRMRAFTFAIVIGTALAVVLRSTTSQPTQTAVEPVP